MQEQFIKSMHPRYLHISIYYKEIFINKILFNSKCEGILSENSRKYKLHINRVFFLLENNDLILSKNCNNINDIIKVCKAKNSIKIFI